MNRSTRPASLRLRALVIGNALLFGLAGGCGDDSSNRHAGALDASFPLPPSPADVGASDASSSATPDASFANPVEGSEKDLDVLGQDADGDTVRDDLERHLEIITATTAERAVAASYAREETALLLLGARPSSSRAAMFAQANRSLRAHRCLFDLVGAARTQELVIRVQAALLNSEVRWRAWIAAERKLRGVIFRDASCDQGLVRP
jgi:hypothetical protein